MNSEEQWLLNEKYHGEKTKEFFTDCARLAAGEPLAYLIGHIPFLNCTISLDSHPLIPRTETEYWTEHAINHIKNKSVPDVEHSIAILDLCAGSGAIGIATAKAIPTAHVTFAEIDPAHTVTIETNCRRNNILDTRTSIITSNLFDAVPGAFDFILTNPPYIDAAAHTVDTHVAAHEPHIALFGGEHGMEIIKRIIDGARTKLTPQGELWIEHEPFQSNAILNLATQNGFTCITHTDQYHTERYSILTAVV